MGSLSLSFKKLNKNIIIWFLASFIGVCIGILVSFFAFSGPFLHFSNNYIFDILKIIFIIIFFSLIIYFVTIQTSKKIASIVFVALFLRLLIVFVMSFFGFLPYQYDSNWEQTASQLLPDWKSGDFYINQGADTYSIITTSVYYFTGLNPIYMQLINAFLGALTVYYIFLISKNLFNQNTAYVSSFIMALWPTHVFFSSMQMREGLAVFLIVSFIYYFIKWIGTFKFKYIFIVGLLFIGNILLRPQNAILLSIAIAPFIIYYLWKYSNKHLKVLVLFFSLLLLMSILGFLSSAGYLSYLSLDYISTEMNFRAGGDAAYLEWMNYNNILDLFIYSPIRLIYFVYTPFPWHITEFAHFIAFIESVMLFVMSIYIALNLKKIIWKKELIFFVLFCLVGLAANGLIDGNVGTAMRHKLQYIYVYIIVFAGLWSKNKEKYK